MSFLCCRVIFLWACFNHVAHYSKERAHLSEPNHNHDSFLGDDFLISSVGFHVLSLEVLKSCNEGRQSVLRSILRRAVRYGKEILKADEGFLTDL
uniref:Alanine--tRNA ligase n=1 Tax=Noccaea caerulescens TaxID=107243 RepID=A0A1J3E107_NOCCA